MYRLFSKNLGPVFVCLVIGIARLFDQEAEAASAPGRDLASVYDPARILEVQVTLDPEDWSRLRLQHPDRLGEMQGQVTNPRPYSLFKATVAINGETLSEISIRKKGNLGSVVSTRPSLKLGFDEYDSKKRFRGLKRLTLNNNVQNGALLHQYLAYHLFRKAGLAAPLCNLAHVTVNGEDLGIYSNVEPIKKGLLKRNFGNGKGDLYESGGDFHRDAYRYFQKKNNRDSNERPALKGVTEALARADDEVLPALEKHLDMEAFYRFWALDVLVGDWDGFICNRNNAYLYRNPLDEKLHIIPWGLDSVFEDPGLYIVSEVPKSVKAVATLPRRLYGLEASRTRYLEVVRELLEEVWDEDELKGLIEQAKGLIKGKLHLPEAYFLKELKLVETFIAERRGEVEAELDAGVPEWPSEGSRPAMSGGMLSTVSKFETTWQGPLGEERMNDGGKGELSLVIDGKPEALTKVFVQAGRETLGPRIGYPLINVEGHSEKFGEVGFYLYVDPFTYGKKQRYPVDFYEVFGIMLRPREGAFELHNLSLMGFVFGQLSLDKSGTTLGDAVSGEFQLQVILN